MVGWQRTSWLKPRAWLSRSHLGASRSRFVVRVGMHVIISFEPDNDARVHIVYTVWPVVGATRRVVAVSVVLADIVAWECRDHTAGLLLRRRYLMANLQLDLDPIC